MDVPTRATWSSITEVTQRRDAWIPLGRCCYVRASEVVAVRSTAGVPVSPEAAGLRAVVMLSRGQPVPAYVTAATVIKRLRAVQP